MPETVVPIRNFSCINLRVEAVNISAQGGPACPRLIIPARLDLRPLRGGQGEDQPFVILNVQCSLCLRDYQPKVKIADAMTDFNAYKVTIPDAQITYNLEFQLNRYRIHHMEQHRIGDMKITLRFQFLVGLYLKDGFLTDFESPFAELTLGIPQSHWVEIVLPALGFGEYFIVEIPKGKGIIKDAWDYLDKSEEAFRSWNSKEVYANCRELGKLLDRLLEKKFGKGHFVYTEKWSRAYEKFNHFASLDLHLEDIKNSPKYSPDKVKTSKADVEHVLIGAKALIKYAEELWEAAAA